MPCLEGVGKVLRIRSTSDTTLLMAIGHPGQIDGTGKMLARTCGFYKLGCSFSFDHCVCSLHFDWFAIAMQTLCNARIISLEVVILLG